MAIALKCRSCGLKLNVADSAAGKRVRCTKCQGILTVPEAVHEIPANTRPVSPKKPKRRRRPASRGLVFGVIAGFFVFAMAVSAGVVLLMRGGVTQGPAVAPDRVASDAPNRVAATPSGRPPGKLHPFRRIVADKSEWIRDAAFASDNSTVVTVNLSGTVRRWNAFTRESLGTFDVPRGVAATAFSPDGKFLAFANDGKLQFLNLATKKIEPADPAAIGPVQSLRFTPDSARLLALLPDREVRCYAVDVRKQILISKITYNNPEELGVTTTGYALIGDRMKSLSWFALPGNELVADAKLSPKPFLHLKPLASPRGTYVAAVGHEEFFMLRPALRVYDARSGEIVHPSLSVLPKWTEDTDEKRQRQNFLVSLRATTFSVDETMLASFNAFGELRIFALETGKRAIVGYDITTDMIRNPGTDWLGSFPHDVNPGLAFSPDGTMILWRYANMVCVTDIGYLTFALPGPD